MSRPNRPTALADKPSKLIEQALEDLDFMERHPKEYEVDMTVWMIPYGNVCKACLAGGVMVRRLKLDPDLAAAPSDLVDFSTRAKLYALDCFRTGDVEEGLLKLNFDRVKPDYLKKMHKAGIEDRDHPLYHENRRGWKLAMRKLVRDLKQAGM